MRSVFYPRLVNGPFGDPALYVHLAHRGQALLFDCGELHTLTVRELLKVRAVFISHCHIDHLVGFDSLLRAFLYHDRSLQLFGPAGITDQLAGRLASYTWNLTAGFAFVLTVREWRGDRLEETVFRAQSGFSAEPQSGRDCADGLLYETPFCHVRAARLEHGDISSLAFCLEEPLHIAIHRDALDRRGFLAGPWLARFKDLVLEQAVGQTMMTVPLTDGGTEKVPLSELLKDIASTERGMKVCYVTDASPTAANLRKIVDFAAAAHLLVIEAVFAHQDLPRARLRNHLTARLAGCLGRLAGALRIRVFHHSPRYLDRPELLDAEAQDAFIQEQKSGS
jgi:ribonuclease Z